MSRTYVILSVCAVSALLLACSILSNRGSADLILDGYRIAIDYGRPLMNEEDVIAATRTGGTWNFGSGSPTIITTDSNIKFGTGFLPAGSHSVWAHRGVKDHWFLVFNSYVGEDMIRNRDLDLVHLPLIYSQQDTHVERFTIILSGQDDQGTLVALWGNHKFEIAFKLP